VQAWQALLARKRLAAASDALKTYGVSSEADVRVLQESDVRASDSTLKPLHRRILREWVKELDQPDCSAIQPGNTTTAASATTSNLYLRLGQHRPSQALYPFT
jgi:hypothetical protein